MSTATPYSETRSVPSTLRDYVALTKPSITRMCLVMTIAGLWLAPGEADAWLITWALLGTAMSVGSANALNMWWERETDQLMSRTRQRPMAAGRMDPRLGFSFGLVLGLASLVVLALGTNLLTMGLGAFALASYVLVYTPLKLRTPAALFVGAIPGAMPPLMGWTAITGDIGAGGLALFGVLLAWQMPHFIAISLFRKSDYLRAGIKVVPVVRGDRVAKLQALAWSTALLPISLTLTPLGVAGTLYFIVAAVLGVGFIGFCVYGLGRYEKRSAYALFAYSLVYLPVLSIALVLDLVL